MWHLETSKINLSLQNGTCLVKFKRREDRESSGRPLDLGGVHWRMLGLGRQANPPFECIGLRAVLGGLGLPTCGHLCSQRENHIIALSAPSSPERGGMTLMRKKTNHVFFLFLRFLN